MKAMLMGVACTAIGAFFSFSPAYAQCPPGYHEIAHWTEGQGDDVTDFWKCGWAGPREARTALQQLRNMGTGYVDTTTGFDGGQGPNAAVATAPRALAQPNLSAVTVPDLKRFGEDPVYSKAVSDLHYATEDRKEAEAKAAGLRQQQAVLKDQLGRQKLQIAIAEAEQQLTAAKGAERIATNKVIKEVIRLKPEVMTSTAKPQKQK